LRSLTGRALPEFVGPVSRAVDVVLDEALVVA